MNLERRGVEAHIVPNREGGLALDDLEEYVDERTRAVAVSAVEFLTGFRNDLQSIGELCKARGIYFVVDGIQPLGVIPLDVRGGGLLGEMDFQTLRLLTSTTVRTRTKSMPIYEYRYRLLRCTHRH